jgi:hypothetical protein
VGAQVDIVPEAVYCYRFTQGSMQKVTDFYQNRQRSLRPYLQSLPASLHPVILNAVFPRRADGSVARPTGLAAEGGSRFHGVDDVNNAVATDPPPPPKSEPLPVVPPELQLHRHDEL